MGRYRQKRGYRRYTRRIPGCSSYDTYTPKQKRNYDSEYIPGSFAVTETVQDDGRVSDLEDDGEFPHKLHKRAPVLRVGSLDGKVQPAAVAKQILESEGYRIRYGRWNKREEETLQKNWETIIDSYKGKIWKTEEQRREVVLRLLGWFFRLDTETKTTKMGILGPKNKFDILNCNWSKFMFKLGKGLPRRSIPCIYGKARNMLSGLRIAQDLTDDEKKAIVDHKQEDKSLSSIELAFLHDCKPDTANTFIRIYLTPDFKMASKEPFGLVEKKKLLQLVMEQSGYKDIKQLSEMKKFSFDWNNIARKLGTNRSVSHVCSTFHEMAKHTDSIDMTYLCAHSEEQLYENMIHIINFLYDNLVEEERSIDWYYLFCTAPANYTSVGLLLTLWEDLKEMVPKAILDEGHCRIVKWLRRHKLLEFRMKLKELKENENNSNPSETTTSTTNKAEPNVQDTEHQPAPEKRKLSAREKAEKKKAKAERLQMLKKLKADIAKKFSRRNLVHEVVDVDDSSGEDDTLKSSKSLNINGKMKALISIDRVKEASSSSIHLKKCTKNERSQSVPTVIQVKTPMTKKNDVAISSKSVKPKQEPDVIVIDDSSDEEKKPLSLPVVHVNGQSPINRTQPVVHNYEQKPLIRPEEIMSFSSDYVERKRRRTTKPKKSVPQAQKSDEDIPTNLAAQFRLMRWKGWVDWPC